MAHCQSCAEARASPWSVRSHAAPQSSQPLELLYGDLSGPMPASRRGVMYVYLIPDDFSGTGWPVFLKDKSADTPLRKRRKIAVHELPGTFRSDNGSEFNNPVFRALLEEYKITTHFTSVGGPERNG
ncbi:unnamed protein product [Hapterophycus canaliculatus]